MDGMLEAAGQRVTSFSVKKNKTRLVQALERPVLQGAWRIRQFRKARKRQHGGKDATGDDAKDVDIDKCT